MLDFWELQICSSTNSLLPHVIVNTIDTILPPFTIRTLQLVRLYYRGDGINPGWESLERMTGGSWRSGGSRSKMWWKLKQAVSLVEELVERRGGTARCTPEAAALAWDEAITQRNATSRKKPVGLPTMCRSRSDLPPELLHSLGLAP